MFQIFGEIITRVVTKIMDTWESSGGERTSPSIGEDYDEMPAITSLVFPH